MGFLSKFKKDEPSSVEHPVEDSTAISTAAPNDPEKAEVITMENGNQTPLPLPTSPPHIDPALEKRVVRKLDKRLVSLAFVLCTYNLNSKLRNCLLTKTPDLLAYLDRSNIGNAKIAGLDTDLHLTSPQYQWLLTIFYISYILFEWFALMWKLIPPHIWATFCVLGWGLTATLQSATTSFSGLMAARFFLGFFEAGYGPGIPYLLSFFYLRHELGFRSGIFLSAAPLATCFAGALAYGITSDDSPRIANWRLLFLVEGLPSIVAGVATFFLMPDSPEKASFLSEEEKEVTRARALRQVGSGEAHRVGHVDFKDIGAALLDLKNYLTALMYFSLNVSFSSLPVFLPTILTSMGFKALHAQALSAPPYFLSFLLVLATTHLADRTQQRGLTILALSLLGATGYIILATTTATAPRYAGVYLAAAGVFPAIGNILPWVLNNQGSDTKRGAGIAMLNLIGQCGPLLGTRVFPAKDAPYYRMGMWVCAGFMLFNAFLACALRALLSWENGVLDRKYGRVERMGGDGKTGGGSAEGGEGAGYENDGPRFSLNRLKISASSVTFSLLYPSKEHKALSIIA
ncbi:MFS transporter [Lachnellula hyalina]|uniref:MFS transporter n=1 Tax=Lachnellula hyalina TaxID=1316788 RepID=A0A8H8QWN2_9HELO|nr:MFS transporter [Lachnellula hyalina]TVY24197.1 MFS transporter [Lachnellula hyalina]